MDAQLFSHGVDDDVEGIAYQPKYPQPPPYIKFRSKFKKEREFDRVFLAQELQAGRSKPPRRRTASSLNSPALQGTPLESDENAVWALEFSKDGKYLAAAGQDRIVRVWAVLSTSEERQLHEQEEDEDESSTRQHRHLEAPVFRKKPIREYEGHDGPIIDLSWSKNNFLLSASADKTVRLWHTSRAECLCTFKHTEHVHSVQFHPRDDRFFLAGSRDMKLRFWSIPDKSVAFWQQLNEIITAVAFTPDGKTAIAGTVNGVCNFYETEGLKYQTQIQVRSAYGKNAKPSKICSIDTINMSERERADVKLLISTNDSRIRLYNFRDKSLETKFKGHKAEERTIKALFSDNGQYIIGGSEDKAAYIWSMGPSESDKPSQRPVEFFEATTSQTTCAAMAPTKARQLLSQSEDPIFDLCNPPPVTLLSRSESVASSRAPSQANSTVKTPHTTESPRKKAMDSPAYVGRTAHPGGNIIVTASNTGVIRVYRQDCAASKRKSAEDSSSIFGGASGKRASSVYMARAMSRSSATGQRNPSRSDSLGTQPPNDRIMTWRQGISSTHSLDRKQSDAKSTRSMSPGKSGYSFRRSGSIRRAVGGGKERRKASVDAMTPTTASSSTPGVRIERASTPSLPLRQSESSGHSPPSVKNGTSSAPLSKQTSRTTAEAECRQSKDEHLHPSTSNDDGVTPLASPSPEVNPLWLQNGQSFLSWNMKEYASQALKKLTPSTSPSTTNNGLLRPDLASQNSTLTVVSKLSSEGSRTPVSGSENEGEEGAGGKRLGKMETLRCRKCGRGSFKAKTTKTGEQRLECQRCGTVAGQP
jgi:WD40 repeat protein/ribosomal protein S27AE